jgi:hypothetical protein
MLDPVLIRGSHAEKGHSKSVDPAQNVTFKWLTHGLLRVVAGELFNYSEPGQESVLVCLSGEGLHRVEENTFCVATHGCVLPTQGNDSRPANRRHADLSVSVQLQLSGSTPFALLHMKKCRGIPPSAFWPASRELSAGLRTFVDSGPVK